MTVKEKMTAPIASVGADVEQPLQNLKTNQSIADLPGKGNLQATNNAENAAKSANKKNPDDLEIVSMMELYDTAYPPKLPIVDGLLYNGTYLFVGSPKIGKSFFMAQIGYHISKGLPLWGFSVRQGTVLYLALEDDYARLQKRLSQMFGMEGSENFYFATKSKSLNDGLEKQLVTFVTEHKDARLIIIDTLQKVRKQNNDINYSNDYTDISLLKQFADKNKIAVILVHHLRKQDDSDVFNRISGTTGIMGSSDTTFILEKKSRDDSVATLFVTGRDVEYQTFTLRFEECRWNLLERSFQKDIEMKNAPEIIYNVISFINDKGEWQGTATELLTSLDEKDITPQYLTKLLNEYSKTILLDNKICFKTSRTSTSRLVNFKKDIDGNDDDDGKNIPQESSLKGSPEGTSGTQLL